MKIQGGHFVPAERSNATLFDERNCHAQSAWANKNMHDPQIVERYKRFLSDKYGEKIVETLEVLSRNKIKYSAMDMRAIGEHFKEKTIQLLIEKGLDQPAAWR